VRKIYFDLPYQKTVAQIETRRSLHGSKEAVKSTGENYMNTTIIFIHGAQHDHACWMLQSHWFSRSGYRVLAPDLPGHGTHAGDALSSVEKQAAWVADLLDTEGIAQVHIVGHSMGSLVALEFAARFPQRTRSATLVGPALPMPVSPVLLELARQDDPKAMEMINFWSFSVAGRLGRNGLPGLWMPGMNKRIMERQKTGVLYTDFSACNNYKRPMESLADIKVPMLIIAGRQDKMTSLKSARAIAEALPQAHIEVLSNCGHAIMTERPNEVVGVLKGFIEAVEGQKNGVCEPARIKPS
jgi:pimeloyl-ACP methyl ester carboxylesterase